MKFIHYDQNQSLLLPPTLSECLPEDHISFVVSDIVNHLDLSEIENEYTEDGHPAYNPKIIIKILFYGYIQGVRVQKSLKIKHMKTLLSAILLLTLISIMARSTFFGKNICRNSHWSLLKLSQRSKVWV